MTREVKFRGYGYDGQWHFGNLIRRVAESPVQESTQEYETFYIQEQNLSGKEIEVFPDTVGQYTGLKDKNGKKIFEGDIVKHRGYHGIKNSVITFEAGAFIVGYHDGSSTKRRPMLLHDKIEVIGNITDNPELMK